MRTPFKQKKILFLAAFLAIVVPIFAISYGHNLIHRNRASLST